MDTGSEITIPENSFVNSHKYIQFSGQGNMILFDNAEGGLEIRRILGAGVHEKGYFWNVEKEGDKVRLRSDEGNYVRYDGVNGTFKTTSNLAEATLFNRSYNNYMLTSEIRYNLEVDGLTGSETAIGLEQDADDNWQLILTRPNNRFSCIRLANDLPTREFPKLSTGAVFGDKERSTWYSIHFKKDNSYLYKTDKDIFCQENPTDMTGPVFRWRFVQANEEGDVYIQSQSGYFVKWDGSHYVLTDRTDEEAAAVPADATPLRIICDNDNSNATTNSGWHIRTISGDGDVFVYNNSGQAGRTGGPKDVTSVEIVENNTDYYRYVVFPAAGSLTLCDGLSNEDSPNSKPHAHAMGTGETNQDHLRWHIKMIDKEGHVTLKNRFGRYLTYTPKNGFGISENEADAYHFRRQRNYYEDNKRLRYEFLKDDNSGEVLRIVDLETGELDWGAPGTRFSLTYTFELVSGPVLPVSSISGSLFQMYRIRAQENDHYCITLTDDPNPDSSGNEITLTNQDEEVDQLWAFTPHYPEKGEPSSFIGDYYMINMYGKYLAVKDGKVITVPDMAEASVIRPIETNSHYYSWQLQVVGLTGNNILSTDGTKLTLRDANHNRNFFRLLPESVYPTFYDIEGGSWRNILFCEMSDLLYMQADGTNVVGKTTTANEESTQWKNIGTADDFVLRNGNDQYIKEETNGYLSLTNNINEARHFYLWINEARNNAIHWTICGLPEDGNKPDIPQRIMQVGTDKNHRVRMVDYHAGILKEDASLQKWTNHATPIFSVDENDTYYYIKMGEDGNKNGLYLNDGPRGVHDAKANEKERLNGFIWRMEGQKNELKLVSRNNEYLVWNPTGDRTFGVTTNPDEAAIFKFHTTAGIGESHSDVTNCYFELIGGPNSNGYTGRYMYRDGEDIKLTRTATNAYVNAEHLNYLDAGDYTKFRILPKRSWFVYKTLKSPYQAITGFLPQEEDYGWTENEYTGKKMQATSTFRITHYMKQGTARNLLLPTIMGANETRLRAYQRWYDYRTDERIPDDRVRFVDVSNNEIINSRRDYANGTIMGVSLPLNYLYGGYIKQNVRFEMPEITTKDYQYVVGADCSLHTDFVDYFGENGPIYSGAVSNEIVIPDHQNIIEPTLSQRCIYDIRDARQMADSLRRCTEARQEMGGKQNPHWLEEHTITFPRKKMGFHRNTVPLNLQLQDYWFYKDNIADVDGDGISDSDNLQNIVSYDHIRFIATSYKDGEVMETNAIGGFDITEWPVQDADNADSDLSLKRFVRFIYPKEDGTGQCAPGDVGYFSGDSCIIKVYARDKGKAGQVGGIRYQLARIKLLFEDNIEPLPYDEVMGLNAQGEYMTYRAPDYMRRAYGVSKANIDFDDPDYIDFEAPPSGKNMHETSGNCNTEAGFTEPNTYGYPLRFENSGYALQASKASGSDNWNDVTWGGYTVNKRTWFEHSGNRITVRPILSLYKEVYAGKSAEVDLIDDSYAGFLYVDASEMPGEICALDYVGNLCTGARLYFSAWVSSVNATDQTPVNIVFTVNGITADGKKEALYSYCPGPISASVRNPDGSQRNPESGKDALWQQIYFSFLNKNGNRYVKYTLNIDNACTNSNGADMLIDDVQIFSQEPNFEIEKTTPVCDQQITLAKMTSEFPALLTALGEEEMHGYEELPVDELPRMWYCILDREVYDRTLAETMGDRKEPTTEDLEKAFYASLLGNPNSEDRTERTFRYAVLNTNYALIDKFTFADAMQDKIDERDPMATGFIRKEMRDGRRYIVVSDRLSSASIRPDHDYTIAYVPLLGGEKINLSNAATLFQWGNPCCIKSDFHSDNAVRFISNGESGNDDHSLTACAGQTIGITPQMRGIHISVNEDEEENAARKLGSESRTSQTPDADGLDARNPEARSLGSRSLNPDSLNFETPAVRPLAGVTDEEEEGDIVYKIERYDWWMDFMGVDMAHAFIDKNGNFVERPDQIAQAGEVNVYQALVNFRHFFPKANSPKDADVVPSETDGYVLTEAMIKGLANLEYKGGTILAQKPKEGEDYTQNFHPLLFNNNTLNLRLPFDMGEEDEVTMTTIPIFIDTEDVQFCFDPQQVSVGIKGKAPSMTDGFDLSKDSKTQYPEDIVSIAIRTGLGFLKKVTATEDESIPYTGQLLHIPLREIKKINENAIGLAPLQREGDAHAYVYIAGSNDPEMNVYEGEDEVVFRKIGIVSDMQAPDKTKVENGKTYAEIYFLKDFRPREGYTYTIRMEYDEMFEKGQVGEITTCNGTLSIDLHIVPKYVVWTGKAENNDWNNDANWKRADLSDLNMTPQQAQTEGYLSNAENGTLHAFAPLDHTHVIIPDMSLLPVIVPDKDLSPLLYDNRKGEEFIEYDGTIHPLVHLEETATPKMKWDLATHEKSEDSRCETFYNYDIRGLVLQSGAELLRSDYLTCDRAWMEYTLNPDRWYTLGTPIQDVYAGDWYTDTKNGHDRWPYFHNQVFTLKTRHSRFAPAIYQKSWDKGEATLYYLKNNSTATEYNEDVAVAANWSLVYNDVDVRYGYGQDIHFGKDEKADGNSGGFSVKGNHEGVLTDGSKIYYDDFLIRIPKEDETFFIYTYQADSVSGAGKPVDRTDSHKLFSEKLKNETGSFTQTLKNNTEANSYFLVGNPFTCGLDMTQFMKKNAGQIDSKYWMLTKEGQMASIKDETSDDSRWITVNDDTQASEGILAPGQGFFVKRAEGVTGNLVLTFDTEMMTSAHEAKVQLRKPGLRRNSHQSRTLRIRAERAGLTSETLIQKDTAAVNDYDAHEDLEVILHNTMAKTPTVYTIAGHQATSINRRRSMYRIPLGVYSNSEEPARLTFSGMDEFDETLSLLDNQTGEVIPLTLSGKTETTVEIPGNTAGRYFILSSEKSSVEDELTDVKPMVEVLGNKVTISANASHLLTYIHIVDAEGRTVYNMSPYQPTLSLKLPMGVYVVDARTDSKASTVKVTVGN